MLVLYTKQHLYNGSVQYIFKLGDFGMSKADFGNGRHTKMFQTSNLVHPGLESGNYDHKIDLRSLRIMMGEMTRGFVCPDFEWMQLQNSEEDSGFLDTIIQTASLKLSQPAGHTSTIPAPHRGLRQWLHFFGN